MFIFHDLLILLQRRFVSTEIMESMNSCFREKMLTRHFTFCIKLNNFYWFCLENLNVG